MLLRGARHPNRTASDFLSCGSRLVSAESFGVGNSDQDTSRAVSSKPDGGHHVRKICKVRSRCRDPRGLGLCVRSEEHTSELQSQFHLVCRLLLEKKKKPPT